MSNSTPYPRPSVRAILGAWAIAVAAALLAGLWTHTGQVRVPFDTYYYVEFAKQFRESAPTSFGVAWPFGWPLLGAATGLLGLGAYAGLVVLAGAAWAGTIGLAALLWPWEETGWPAGTLALSACATTAAALQFIATVFSEVPFGCVLLGFAYSLTRWPAPRAVLLSCGLALLAFSLRYVGAICFVLLAVQLALRLRAGTLTRHLLIPVLATGLLAAGLLLWNRVATGHWSGYPRGASEPVTAWLGIAADLGWSLPTLLAGLRARELLGFSSGLGPVLGLVALAAVFAIGWSGLRRQNPVANALGLIVLAYAGAMVVLRCIGRFDALSTPRTGLVLLVPLLLLLAPVLRRRALLIVPVLWLALNAAFLLRGPNLGASADVHPALAALPRLLSDDFLSANDDARTLSALVDARVHRLESAQFVPGKAYGAAILLAAPAGNPASATLSAEWILLARQLVASGAYRVAHESTGLLLLVRHAPATP